eukprot:6143-Chlamydomonas_euryale.AAC.2
MHAAPRNTSPTSRSVCAWICSAVACGETAHGHPEFEFFIPMWGSGGGINTLPDRSSVCACSCSAVAN